MVRKKKATAETAGTPVAASEARQAPRCKAPASLAEVVAASRIAAGCEVACWLRFAPPVLAFAAAKVKSDKLFTKYAMEIIDALPSATWLYIKHSEVFLTVGAPGAPANMQDRAFACDRAWSVAFACDLAC